MKAKDKKPLPDQLSDKEQAIFAATIELVAEVGLTGLKMADIARRAKIASGTLYLYFTSKEELLNAIYRKLKRDHAFLSAASEEDAGLPLRLKFRRIWELALRHGLTHYRETLFTEQFVVSPYINDESREVSSEVTRFIIELIEAGKRDTLIKPLDNALLLCLMSGFLRETAAYCRKSGQEVSPELVESTFTLCWDALKA